MNSAASEARNIETPSIAGVIVTFNSDVDRLSRTLDRLLPTVSPMLVMDNSDDVRIASIIEKCCCTAGAHYVSSDGNVGIAVAQNRGIDRALDAGASYIMFLDDDSDLDAEAPARLAQGLRELRSTRPSVVAVGPLIVDRRTNQPLAYSWSGRHLVHRTDIDEHSGPIDVAFLLGSGALVDAAAFARIGLFREEYFIDHVDKEWGLRAGSLGFEQVVLPSVVLSHALGDAPVNPASTVTGRYVHHNATRDYYLTRNAILMIRDLDLPPIKHVGMVRLLVEMSIRKIVAPTHRGQRRAIVDGIVDGLRGRSGPRNEPSKGHVPLHHPSNAKLR